MTRNSYCVVCGSGSIKKLYKLRDYRLDCQTKTYDYFRCLNCGLIFQNPSIPFNDIKNHYNQNLIYKSINSKGINRALNIFGLHKRTNLILKQNKSGKLLDIGCGSGAFIEYLSNNSNLGIVGTEINKKYVNELRNKKGLDVRIGNLNEIGFSKNEFDFVTMWDVIEHVTDPNEILIEVSKILKTKGFLIFRVPNGDSLDFKLFRKYWAGLDAPRHYYVFNEASLKQMLENNGYEIVSRDYQIGGYLNAVTSFEFLLNDLTLSLRMKEIVLKILRSPILQVFFFPLFWLKTAVFKGTSITITARLIGN